MAMQHFWTVLIQLKLKQGKQPLKPGRRWKMLQAGLLRERRGSGGHLPSPADAGHLGMKLAGEAATCPPFQERGPDGWLK